MKRLALFFVMMTLVCAGSISAGAQEDRGRISGLVSDQTGAVVPKADVSLLNEATNVQLTTVTNAEGAYTFDLLI